MKILKKVWGIGLVVVLLASMLLTFAAPVSAGTLLWSVAPIPVATYNQIAAADASVVRVAPNGDIFAVDGQANPDRILKSVNGGTTWTVAVTPLVAGNVIADLQISPSYASDNTIIAVVNTTAVTSPVYAIVSSNGGATFVQLGGNITATAGEVATSLSVEPTYTNGTGQIAVATSNVGAAVLGAIYTWGTNGTLNWVTLGAPATDDYTTVAFSPMYPIDTTIVAIGTPVSGTGARVHLKVGIAAWNTVSDSAVWPLVFDAAAENVGGITTGDDVISTSIAFPADFNAAIPTARNMFIGINRAVGGTATGGVYRVSNATATPLAFAVPTSSVAFKGNFAAGTLFAGTAASTNVSYCANANAPAAWVFVPATKPATGATLPVIALSGDNVYVGTTGVESAFNVSTDNGINYVQKGLIDTTFAIGNMVTVSATNWFLVNNPGGAALDSIWETTDGGSTYVRIYTMPAVGNVGRLAISPDFATDKTMYFYEPLVAGAGVVRMSQDAGKTWSPRALPTATAGGVQEMVVVDAFTVYVIDAGANNVYKSINNCWTWTAQNIVTAGAGFTDIEFNAASGAVLVGDTTSQVFISTDGLTWKGLGRPGAVAVGTDDVIVAFDANYATNKLIYGAYITAASTGVAGIWRTDSSAAVGTNLWRNIDTSVTAAPVGAVRDILIAPDGAMYYSDVTAAAGVQRILNPTLGMPLAAGDPTPQNMAGPAGMTFTNLAMVEGSNIVYAVDSATPALYTFTDNLTQAVPDKTAPAADAILTNTGVLVAITPVAQDTLSTFTYQVQWGNRADFLGATTAIEAFNGFPSYNRILNSVAAIAGGVPAGSTIYYRVRVNAPYFGPWSDTYTVETQLNVANAPNAPVVLSVAGEGGTAAGGWGASLQPAFYWRAVVGATTYEFQLATDTAFTNLIVDATGADALGNVSAYQYTAGTLDYDTTYFWRVRALSGTSLTEWSLTQGFTTLAEEVEPTATATATQPAVTQTTVTFTQPAATTQTTVVEETAPAYIWAIIVVGAVLVIAVIVLIVRTRRSV